MKMNKVIVNMALAAGLLAFAPIQTQAGLVIDNSLVSPFKVKLVGSYVNDKNKIVKVSISNKDILSDLGAPKNSQLAYWESDIVVINNKAIWDDGFAFISFDSYTYNQIDGKNGSSKYAENGLVNVAYEGTDFSFDVNGVYNYHYYESVTKNGDFNVAEDFKSSSLTGSGYDNASDLTLPVTGSWAGGGSGNISAN